MNTELAAHAFFVNLLPEGRVREAVARQLGLSATNDFGLLEAVGGECAGAHAAAHGGSPVIQRLRRVVRKQCRRSLQLLGA